MRCARIKRLVIIGVSGVAVSVGGCSGLGQASKSGSISSVVRAAEYNLETVSTPQEQARDAIMRAPTTFEVSRADDEHCWERARIFLENYSGVSPDRASVVSKVVGSRVALVSNPSQSLYTYEVSKELNGDSYTYHITCTALSGGDSSQAALNAGNLSRFVKDGELEISLLQSSGNLVNQ